MQVDSLRARERVALGRAARLAAEATAGRVELATLRDSLVLEARIASEAAGIAALVTASRQ